MMIPRVRRKMKTQRIKGSQSARPERVLSFATELILGKKLKVNKGEV